jgi:3-oxoacyl-[acyl-carrier-protein] synthase-3
MEHAADVLGIPMSRVLRNIQEYGNTSAGSIPLALAEAVKEGKVKKGDIIAVAGFGAGLSWASAIIKY